MEPAPRVAQGKTLIYEVRADLSNAGVFRDPDDLLDRKTEENQPRLKFAFRSTDPKRP